MTRSQAADDASSPAGCARRGRERSGNGIRVAVIGAGYAGMAAAAELAARRIPVTVFEASRRLGGRARAVEVRGTLLDSGQHILLGAYRETLRLMRLVGVDAAQALSRQPLTLAYPGELRLAAARLSAPLHLLAALLGARGLNWREKLAALGFMQTLKRCGFRLAADTTASDLFAVHAQPQRVRSYLWEPLCLAALNTLPDQASAQVFVNVLQDSLGAERAASDLLLPCVDLSSLFPDAAAAYVGTHGGAVLRGTAIRQILRDGDAWLLQGDQQRHGHYSHVIIAVAPYHLAALVDDLPQLAGLRQVVGELRHEPIVTCYIAYPPRVRLPQAMLGHVHGSMQWLFDRGRTGGPPGLLAAVISAQGPHLDLSRQEMAARIHGEIAGIVPNLPAPLWSQVITEKRATFACTPGIKRPAMNSPLPGLLLAGDYVAGKYPATLESAVRSGVAAAKAILD